MKNYLLLIKNGDSKNDSSAAEERIQDYIDYAQHLKSTGHFVTADGVKTEARLLKRDQPTEIGDSSAVGAVNGFYILSAENFDQAEELARLCPALKFGHTLELREQEDY